MSEAITCIEINHGELNTVMRPPAHARCGRSFNQGCRSWYQPSRYLAMPGRLSATAQCLDIPSLEIAGTVAALGIGVTDLTVGKKVMALVTGGGYAQYCTPLHPNVSTIPLHWRWTRRRRRLRLFYGVLQRLSVYSLTAG